MSGLFGGGSTSTPVVEAPKPAPDPDDKAVKRANERTAQRKYATSGRASTVLSEESKLG